MLKIASENILQYQLYIKIAHAFVENQLVLDP